MKKRKPVKFSQKAWLLVKRGVRPDIGDLNDRATSIRKRKRMETYTRPDHRHRARQEG